MLHKKMTVYRCNNLKENVGSSTFWNDKNRTGTSLILYLESIHDDTISSGDSRVSMRHFTLDFACILLDRSWFALSMVVLTINFFFDLIYISNYPCCTNDDLNQVRLANTSHPHLLALYGFAAWLLWRSNLWDNQLPWLLQTASLHLSIIYQSKNIKRACI